MDDDEYKRELAGGRYELVAALLVLFVLAAVVWFVVRLILG